ncbi:MAG TPA: hypothetical protein VFX89_22580 [Gammaproteobacteria bacterium]|nr:hypothetical protein [Gammaproteobacteria bacterium]
MGPSAKNLLVALALVVLGLSIAAGGIYVGDKDDAPGASLMAIVLMLACIALAVRTARRKT